MVCDILRRLGGLHRKRFDLRGNHGKALAGVPGPCRFDCGVERQQIGLFGNLANELDNIADLLCAGCKCRDLAVGRVRLFGRKTNDFGSGFSCRLISAIEPDSSSAAAAAISTLREASLKAATAISARRVVWPDEANSAAAVVRIALALSLTLESSFSTSGRNMAIALSTMARLFS